VPKIVAFVLSIVATMFACSLGAGAKQAKPRELTKQEATKVVDAVKHDWHSMTGESAEQIIAAASKVAHFIPRRWDASIEDGKTVVSLGWAKHRADKSDEQYGIFWSSGADGKITVGPPYAKVMELGQSAFLIPYSRTRSTRR
jgi:hypothetical protein